MPKQSQPSALITGGAKGMGRAIALALAEDGYNIGIVTRKSEVAAKATVKRCELLGVRARYWKADLIDIKATERVAREFTRHFGQWDVLVNNVGDYWAGPSHCLPTGTTARFASGVSVYTFLKRSGTVYYRDGMPARD